MAFLGTAASLSLSSVGSSTEISEMMYVIKNCMGHSALGTKGILRHGAVMVPNMPTAPIFWLGSLKIFGGSVVSVVGWVDPP